MKTREVDLTAGGKLSELLNAQYGESRRGERCAAMALQNPIASGATIYFGSVGAPFHEMLQGQTTIMPIGNTKDVAFQAAAVTVVVSLFSER